MNEKVINAAERTEKPNKVRKEGFIPGVVYGKEMPVKSVKFDKKELEQVLQGHVRNTKIMVKLGDDTKQCMVKDIQRDPIKGKILHIEMQAIHADDIIRSKVPIIFTGREKMAGRQELLQEYVSEVEVMGKASAMPEFVAVDMENRQPGDKITVKDIQVGAELKVMGNVDETIAVITAVKEINEEEAGSDTEKTA